MTVLNIREQETVAAFENVASFKRLLLNHLNGEFATEVRKVLSALATALEFRRYHPKPQDPPFQGKKPRGEQTIFFLGVGFIRGNYVCVGVHEDGWVVLFTSYVSTQMPQFEADRYVTIVADWSTSELPWLAEAVDPDRRAVQKVPGVTGAVSNFDLYPFFLEWVYSGKVRV